MKYFKCDKCENIYCFPYAPYGDFMQCGAYMGTKNVGGREDVPVGCGGALVEISEEAANLIADSMR